MSTKKAETKSTVFVWEEEEVSNDADKESNPTIENRGEKEKPSPAIPTKAAATKESEIHPTEIIPAQVTKKKNYLFPQKFFFIISMSTYLMQWLRMTTPEGTTLFVARHWGPQ